MSDLPSGWMWQGLQPQIKIYDWEGNLAYTYEHSQISASPTQDFGLFAWDVSQGIGTNFGKCSLGIIDHENLLTDLTSSRRPTSIRNEYTVEIALGKSVATLGTKRFVGRIQEGSISRLPKQQYITLFATGLGTLLPLRHTKIAFEQTKDSTDPLAFDDTDSNAKASELVKDIIEDSENYLTPQESLIPFGTAGIEDIDVKIANFDKRPATPMDVAINELNNMSGADWGIDYSTNDVWMRYPGSASSGFLITNDLSSTLTQNWDPDKIGVIVKRARSYTDSTVGYATPFMFGMGALDPVSDIDNSLSDAAQDLSAAYVAVEYTANQDNVWIFAPWLDTTGTPSKDLIVSLIASDINGVPDPTNVAQTRVISKERLQAITGTGQYLQIEFDRVAVAPKTKMFFYFEKYGDATNFVDLDYQASGAASEIWTSSDGTTWNDPFSGGFGKLTADAKMRVYSAKAIQINYVNTALAKKFGNVTYPKELVMPTPNIHKNLVIDMFSGISQVRSRQNRLYDPITIYPPTDPIPLGKTVRYVDRYNGLDVNVDVQSYSLSGNVNTLENNGANRMTLDIREAFAGV